MYVAEYSACHISKVGKCIKDWQIAQFTPSSAGQIAFQNPNSFPIIHYCRPFSRHLSNSLKLGRLQPIRIKSLRSSSSALALLLTSTQRQTLRKAFNSRESLLGFFRRGVPLVAIRKRAFKGSSFRYGGSDSIISIAIIPRDQMSTFGPYSFCLTTSGAIQ